jgi:methylase of polypeptide subunit release factors
MARKLRSCTISHITPMYVLVSGFFTYMVYKETIFKALVVPKSILELGSGVGFLGIIVGTLQLEKVSGQSGSLWLTDVSDEVLQRCRENLSLPCSKLRFFVFVLLRWKSILLLRFVVIASGSSLFEA